MLKAFRVRLQVNRSKNGTIKPWLSILGTIIITQIFITWAISSQRWSMPMGLAGVILFCAALTLKFRTEHAPDVWRCYLVAVGLVIWALGFVAISIQDNFFREFELYSGFAAATRQSLFVAALMPTSPTENSRKFQFIDIVQGILVAALLGVLTWRPLFQHAYFRPDDSFVITGYNALAGFSLLSYFLQEDVYSKRLVGRVAILLIVYGLISQVAIKLHQNYNIQDNSLIWAIGDISFVVYACSYTNSYPKLFDLQFKPKNNKHLAPLLVTLAIMLLSVTIANINLIFAMAAGAAGIIIYSLRTTMLLNAYLKTRDVVIQAEQAHSRLLIDMIHEIRAPLGSVVLNAAMLQRIENIEGQQAIWLQHIGISGARVTAMLNDVLDIERIDAGLVHPIIGRCNVCTIVQSSISVVAADANAAVIKIDVQFNDEISVLADKNMLERVLINVLANAVRFTPAGGTIAIACFLRDRRGVILRIADTGVGISKELQPKLFGRFSRLAEPLRGSMGSGLGLSICQGLMNAMGGRIAIESELGEGTVVTLELKRAL